jgi:hypothetical protein
MNSSQRGGNLNHSTSLKRQENSSRGMRGRAGPLRTTLQYSERPDFQIKGATTAEWQALVEDTNARGRADVSYPQHIHIR